MLKEIYEQPEVLQTCLSNYLSEISPSPLSFPPPPSPFAFNLPTNLLTNPQQIHILASGTSRHAGLVAQYWLEQIVGIPTRVRSASEFQSAPLPLASDTLTIAITQSGETADTLAAAEHQKLNYSHLAKPSSSKLLGITNQPDSSLAKIVDYVLPTFAENEVGVAATKTFTTQLIVLACLAFDLAFRLQRIDSKQMHSLLTKMQSLPEQIEIVLSQQKEAIQQLAQELAKIKSCIVLGQGINQAIALEGALRLKETTYIHAEGYDAGEFLHGPIALLDSNIPVIAIETSDHTYKQVIATVQKIKSHNVPVIGITMTSAESETSQLFDHQITLPEVDSLLSPFLTVIPLQLLAYYIAVQRGLNVDRPRNITKTLGAEQREF